MKRTGLNNRILNRIKDDPILYGKVAKSIGVKPYCLPRLLRSNHSKLTLPDSICVIMEHLGENESKELFAEVQVKVRKTSKKIVKRKKMAA